MTGYIYCISNTINDKLYVGKTLLPIEKRFREHCYDSSRQKYENRPLYRAMNKYGVENFKVSLLEKAPAEILDIKEQYWIDKLGSYKLGYNATQGGEGKLIYDEDEFTEDFENGLNLKEIAEKHKCSDTTVRQRLQAQGYNSGANGYKCFENSVLQYDLNGNYITTFKSYAEAARSLISQGLSLQKEKHLITNIGRVVKGKRKSCCGYIWKDSNINHENYYISPINTSQL